MAVGYAAGILVASVLDSFSARMTGDLARLAMGARRRLSGLHRECVRVGRFEIPMLVGGPADDPCPLVLLHGFSDTKDSFVDVARFLTRSRRVVLPDLPGFSEASQPVDHHYTITTIAEVITGVIAEVIAPGKPRSSARAVHLVGNSLGGAVTALIAIEQPAWVRSLTLIGAAGIPMPVPSALQRHIEAGHNPFVLRSEDEFMPWVRFVLERVPFMPAPVARSMARDFVARQAMNQKLLAEIVLDDFDLTERLAEIRAPTLVLWGDRDRLIDLSVGRVYHRGIPQSRLVVMHGIGHCPQVEAPRATARRILETVARSSS